MLSARQRSRMAKKARRRRYLELRERMLAEPTDFNRFQYACRVPIMRQVHLALDLLLRPRPSWEPPA